MKKLISWIFTSMVLCTSLWSQAQGQGTQAPATSGGQVVNAGKKTPEGKGEHRHHHHKHHHHEKQTGTKQ